MAAGIGAALIAGGASLAGGAMSSLGGAKLNRKNRQFYREQMSIQRAREDTAVQRRMADLEAAGVNPLMAVTSGMSADSSMGSMPQQSNAGMENAGNIIANMPSAIGQYKNMQKNLKLVDTQIDNMRVDTEKKRAEIDYIMTDTTLTMERIGSERLMQAFISAGTDERRMHIATMAKGLDLLDAQIEETYGRIDLNSAQEDLIIKQMDKLTQDMDINEINRAWIYRNWNDIMKLYKSQIDAELWSARPDWARIKGLGGFIGGR